MRARTADSAVIVIANSIMNPYDSSISNMPAKMMMIKPILLSGILLAITGCSSSPPGPAGVGSASLWQQAGERDALEGKVVKDNEMLAEWYGNPQVDRDDYLKGYTRGQIQLCRPATMRAWGVQAKPYPASCDGVADAEQLRSQWQQGIDGVNN